MRIFTKAEEDEFFEAHVAHRLTALLAVGVRLGHDPHYFRGCGDIYCACVEGSFSMLRIFIEFLGLCSYMNQGTIDLGERSRTGKRPVKDTDVMIDNFGLPLVRKADVRMDAPFLAMMHDGVSKSTSHFTFDTGHGFDPEKHFGNAAELVVKLLEKHFYQPLARKPLFHPDLPPFRFT